MNRALITATLLIVATAANTTAHTDGYTVAVLPFEGRGTGMSDRALAVSDLLFSHLTSASQLTLVERAELARALDEAELGLTGLVTSEAATRVGQLTGAQLLLTGSVFRVDQKTFVVAKLIGTETGRVVGQSVDGTGDLATLVDLLAAKVTATISTEGPRLVASRSDHATGGERLMRVRHELGDRQLPAATFDIREQHVGARAPDPAAETELIYFYRKLGGEVIDRNHENAALATYRFVGEGMSEFATRTADLVSVKARLEVRVLDRAGKVVAAERESATVVDLSEQIAGKAALMEASARIAARILPQLGL